MLGLTVATMVATAPEPPQERLVRVYGDLAGAERIAVVVPGSDTTAAAFERGHHRPGGAARALLAEAGRIAPGTKVAVVAWLGYDSPAMLSLHTVMTDRARAGGAALSRTLESLARRTSAPITLICHSYGALVCGHTRLGPGVRTVAIGSPGLADGAAPDWAGMAGGDWVARVPRLRIGPIGYGADPRSAARVFATGTGGHSDYFAPGGVSLRNLTLLVLRFYDRVSSTA
ncbi:hypothetical protein GCM10009560_54160 [Nonomuraea longicatena]|uniref:DUF1023 domain-containing protein n=1 Tax=Nonomuraea longicatena TaxID=83682 RepID=A0ABP4AVM9_9ACTN